VPVAQHAAELVPIRLRAVGEGTVEQDEVGVKIPRGAEDLKRRGGLDRLQPLAFERVLDDDADSLVGSQELYLLPLTLLYAS
jgi:hypothetical protein